MAEILDKIRELKSKINTENHEGETELSNIIKGHKGGWEETAISLINSDAYENLTDKQKDGLFIDACRYKCKI